MSQAMRFPCPDCDLVTPQPVVSTDRRTYYWSDRHSSSHVGSMTGVDVQCWVRERRCERCDEQTRTVETSADVLAALVGEVDRLSALLEAQTRHETLSSSRHLPGAIAFVADVLGYAATRSILFPSSSAARRRRSVIPASQGSPRRPIISSSFADR